MGRNSWNMWKLVSESAQKDKQNILFLLTTILSIRTVQVGEVCTLWLMNNKEIHKNLNIHWSSLTAPRLLWYLWELDDWLRMLIDAMSAIGSVVESVGNKIKKWMLYAINELVNLTDFLFGAVQESSRRKLVYERRCSKLIFSPESNRRKLV
jgi:hypothetical protein